MVAKYELLRRLSTPKQARRFRYEIGELVILNDPTNDHEVGRGEVELQVLKNGEPVYQLAGFRGLYSETFLEPTAKEVAK